MSYMTVSGRWAPRLESPDAIGRRCADWLSELGEIDPVFRSWIRDGIRHRSAVPRIVTLPPDAAELRQWVAENPIFESRDGRKATVGYSVSTYFPHDGPVSASFWLRVDCTLSNGWLRNWIGLSLYSEEEIPRRVMVRLDRALLVTAREWGCDWAAVDAADYREPPRKPSEPLPRYEGGAVVYLDASLAERIDEPEDVAIERLSGGAIVLTAVPNAVFDRGNKIHRAAARRIQTALARLDEGTGE